MAKFVKGQSGNPTGRPKEDASLKELARAKTPAAIKTLAEVMTSKNSPAAARVAAASVLLDRGHGKPHQSTSAEVTGKDGEGLFDRLEEINRLQGLPREVAIARRIAFAMQQGARALDDMANTTAPDGVN